MVQQTRAVTAQRGGFHRPFGLWEFIAAYLNGESIVDDIDFDPLEDPALGSSQTDVRAAYNDALTRERAQRKAMDREGKDARRQGREIEQGRVDELAARFSGELEGSRRTVKRGSLSYNSFTVYFGMLRSLGWVEETGQTEPSVFQAINPGSPDRKFFRLTSAGLANRSVSNPKAVYGGAPAAPRQAPAPRPAPTPRPAAPVAPPPIRPAAPAPKPTAPAPKPVPDPRPAPPLPPPGFEADPKEVAALNAMLKSGLLTTRNFKEAVDLLTGGQARTAKDAADQAIRQKAAQTREKAGGSDTEALSDIWDDVTSRIQGWQKPNSTNAEKAVDRFVEEAVELGAVEDDVEAALSDVRPALEAYKNLDRSEYDSAEEYSTDRADAWEVFTSSLDDVDFGNVKFEEK